MKRAIIMLFWGVLVIASFNIPAIASVSVEWYWDNDGDGYGDLNSPLESASQPAGYVSNNNDCVDYDSSIHPGATEIYGDGIDQDCNGSDRLSLLSQTQVSQLYVSIFGRASEGDGNAYWSSEQDNMTTAADTMLNTEAAKAYFGETLDDNQAFIEFIYENTLGKTYAEDPAGVNYWVHELAGGKSKGEVVATLINAAIDPQYAGLAAQDQFLNKVTVSNYTADIIASADVNDLSPFVNFISSVTDDPATVVTAKAAVDEQANVTGVSDCNSSHLNLCTAEGSCFTAGGYWLNNTCNSEPPVLELVVSAIEAHNSIIDYSGSSTCIGCHQQEAAEMLDSLHMKWSGPTPYLSNTDGEAFGKGVNGINTFCTYAMSSKAACFSCHVRADGNAPDPVQAEDVDCLMCHSDTYQRKFISDAENTETVTNILGQIKTYVFGKVDAQGNYTTVPDYDKMPEGTSMVNVARAAHLPTNDSCLRCHATAGGGDWTKRGDMGLNSAHATVEQDVHLAKDGANLSCVNCHSALNHKIGGRGIDLRQTEAEAPTCKSCHDDSPHSSSTLNRHAQGQVSCQVCHIREYAKGGATEMSRDWSKPVWNAASYSGQGGFVGEEIKVANVKPEYVWFDGTSYVYNVGEIIEANPDTGVFNMAKANGTPFDGRSQIVPIKRHSSILPWHESGKMVPPVIMWMFMTGDFDLAVEKGMEEQGMAGTYSIVDADAEMLITHGVDLKEKAPSCVECHNNSGSTPDGVGMVPFDALGYHNVPAKVKSCNLCHEQESMNWDEMHTEHKDEGLSCVSCHTSEPTGFVKDLNDLCSSCHEQESWKSKGHEKHIEKRVQCASCHTFS